MSCCQPRWLGLLLIVGLLGSGSVMAQDADVTFFLTDAQEEQLSLTPTGDGSCRATFRLLIPESDRIYISGQTSLGAYNLVVEEIPPGLALAFMNDSKVNMKYAGKPVSTEETYKPGAQLTFSVSTRTAPLPTYTRLRFSYDSTQKSGQKFIRVLSTACALPTSSPPLKPPEPRPQQSLRLSPRTEEPQRQASPTSMPTPPWVLPVLGGMGLLLIGLVVQNTWLTSRLRRKRDAEDVYTLQYMAQMRQEFSQLSGHVDLLAGRLEQPPLLLPPPAEDTAPALQAYQRLQEQVQELSQVWSSTTTEVDQLRVQHAHLQQAYETFDERLRAQVIRPDDIVLPHIQTLEERLVQQETTVKQDLAQLRDQVVSHEAILQDGLVTLHDTLEQWRPLPALLSVESAPADKDSGAYKTLLDDFFRVLLTDSTRVQEALTTLSQRFQNWSLPAEVEHTLASLAARLDAIAVVLTELRGILAVYPHVLTSLDKVAQSTAQLQHNLRTVLQGYRDFQLDIVVPVSLRPDQAATVVERVARALRTTTQQLHDPVEYFTTALDQLICGDFVAVLDLCDGLDVRDTCAPHLQHLLASAGLQDILPGVGEEYTDAVRAQALMTPRLGAPRNQIVAVIQRGLQYKGRMLRQARVEVGR